MRNDDWIREKWEDFLNECRCEKVVISLFFPYAANCITFNPFREVELGLSYMDDDEED